MLIIFPAPIFVHLMSKRWAIRFLSKVDAEVVVHLHPAVLRVDVDDEHHGALGGDCDLSNFTQYWAGGRKG